MVMVQPLKTSVRDIDVVFLLFRYFLNLCLLEFIYFQNGPPNFNLLLEKI